MSTTIIADLQFRGFSLQVTNGQLHVRPKALLAVADREVIRTHLAEIIAALTPHEANASSTELPAVPTAGGPWDLGEAIRLMNEADDLVERLGMDGRRPALAAAAATVMSAFATRDMETLQFAIADFEVTVRLRAAVSSTEANTVTRPIR